MSPESPPATAPRTPTPTAVAAPEVRSWITIARLVRRFGARAGATAVVVVLQLLRIATELAVPFLLGRTIGSLQGFEATRGGLPEGFRTSVVLMASAIVARAALTYASAVAAGALAQDLENGLRTELFNKVLRLRFRWHDENRAGKTIARSLGDMEKAKAFYREVAFGYVEMALLVLGVVTLSFQLHWTFGLAATLVFGVNVVAISLAGARIARMDRGVSDLYDRVTVALQENVAGARVVRAFGLEPDEVDRFGGRLGTYSTSWKRLERYWTTVLPIINHAAVLVVPVSVAVGVLHVAAAPGPASVADALSLLFYMRTVRERLRPLTRLVLVGQKAVASATRVFEVIDRPEETLVSSTPRTLPAAGGEVVLDDVWFSHPTGRPVLKGVSLRVAAGGSLGILGRTGSGKTSLVHLLPRFYDPDRGRVLLDGVDVRDLDPTALAHAVGLVFQEPFLFSATVRQNVAYGKPDASIAEVERACRLAAAHEFVAGLPNGYDTLVGERGVSLSGGQRQRLTIARAILAEPRVLVFDDATASVDAVTEKELFRGIRAAATGRTSLVISQRVTSVRWCDRIAVVEDGRVTAIGPHAELLDASELYREIHEHQTLERAAR